MDEVDFQYNKAHPIFKKICVNANMESRICIVSKKKNKNKLT